MDATEIAAGLRIANETDLPQIAQLWLEMFEEVGKHREADFRPDWRARFVEYCTGRMRAGDLRFFVADEAGRVAGCAGAVVRDGYPLEIHGIRNGYIFGVSVRTHVRKRGIATALTKACVDWLEQTGTARVLLHASPSGRPIYERMGFVPTNEMELPKRLP